MIAHYLRDDVETIRGQFKSAKVRKIAFLGMPWPARSVIEKTLEGPEWEFWYRGSGTNLPQIVGGEYLGWLSGCEAIMDLPGDTWNSYRFGEAAMMGVPLVEDRGKINVTPALSDDNCILVDGWGDREKMLAALERIDEIKAGADAAYREGWSMRGQLIQACKKAEVPL